MNPDSQNINTFNNEVKAYNTQNEKIDEIDEKIQIAKKQNSQRLCIPFEYEEMKKLQIAYNYKYDHNQKSRIIEHIKENIIKEVDEILKEMKDNFFK